MTADQTSEKGKPKAGYPKILVFFSAWWIQLLVAVFACLIAACFADCLTLESADSASSTTVYIPLLSILAAVMLWARRC
jgi:hypothetical protein